MKTDRAAESVTCKLRDLSAVGNTVDLHCIHGRTYVNVLDFVTAFVATTSRPFADVFSIRYAGKPYTMCVNARLGDEDSSLYSVIVVDGENGDLVNLAVNFSHAVIKVTLDGARSSALQVNIRRGLKVLCPHEANNLPYEELAEYENQTYVPVLRFNDAYYTVLSSMVNCRPKGVEITDMLRGSCRLPVKMVADPRLYPIEMNCPFYISSNLQWPEGVVQIRVDRDYDQWADGMIVMFALQKVPVTIEPLLQSNIILSPGQQMSLGVAMSQLAAFAAQQGSVKKLVRQ